MKPENRLGKYMLLDVDSVETREVDAFVIQHLIQVIYRYRTPQGWHYIVEPFNVILAQKAQSFEVKKDALMLLRVLL